MTIGSSVCAHIQADINPTAAEHQIPRSHEVVERVEQVADDLDVTEAMTTRRESRPAITSNKSGETDRDRQTTGHSEATTYEISDTARSEHMARSAELLRELPRIGDQLGRFRLDEMIGRGGMGVVYRAQDLSNDQPVAVKVLRQRGDDLTRAIRRFSKEARLLGNIENDYVTRLYDVGVQDGHHYLAMEFVDGTDLKQWLKHQKQLDERDAMSLIADIARGLAEAHDQQIVHRDIKPENILLVSRKPNDDRHVIDLPASELQVKLSDFGIARHVRQSSSMEVTKAGTLLGTPRYMSPEQCKGDIEITPAADIYSLGITLYLMLCGQTPFESDDTMKLAAMHCFDPPPEIQQRNRNVSDETSRLLDRMLAKLPKDRFADASQLISSIDRLMGSTANDFDAHPKLPLENPDRLWHRVFEWDLKSSAADLWPLVSNTERLNRAAGLQSVQYRTEKDPRIGVRKFGSFRLGGVTISWEEHPFEWIEGSRMGILREFASGPMKWFMSSIELQPKPAGGTRLIHTVKIETRNAVGRFLATVEAGWKGGKSLDRIYRRIDESLQNRHDGRLPHDPFEPPEKMSTAGAERLNDRVDRMTRLGVAPDVAEQIGEFVREAAPQTLAQIRPLDLADQLQVNAQDMIDACLVAAGCDLFDLRWDILCPTCRAPASTESFLGSIDQHTQCEACDVEFQSNVANAIEMVFQVDPEIRSFDDSQYCIGGPEHSPHVVCQLRLEAQEKIEVDVSLDAGDYLLRGPGVSLKQPIRVRNEIAPTRLNQRLSQFGSTTHTPVVRAGRVNFVLTNDHDAIRVVRLERTIDRMNVVTAADASTLPRFRELFPEQTFDPSTPVATEQVTLLAAVVNNVDQVYESLDEQRAYLLLQRVVEEIAAVVKAHGGAVVKTVGEALLASFPDGTLAARAALAANQVRPDGIASSELQIGVGVHRGHTLVTTQNGRLDYFGRPVRLVMNLAVAAGNDVVLTDAVFSDTNVGRSVREVAATSRFETVSLPRRPQPARAANRLKFIALVRRTVAASTRLIAMGLTYFKRYRMEFDLSNSVPECAQAPAGYDFIPYTPALLKEHAQAKYESFCQELDAIVFPCLGRRDGCLRLMREITSRATFIPEATWLCRVRDPDSGRPRPVGTIQGLQIDEWGAVQNIGIDPSHRGRGLGSILLSRAGEGFRRVGLKKMHLEVTTDNTAAIRLYERLGFRRAQVVYKAAEVAGV